MPRKTTKASSGPGGARPKRTRRPRPEPGTLKGSREAKRIAAVMLEVLSGLRSTTDATEVLGMSSSRYYQLETRALQGLITALEPRTRGGAARRPEAELVALRRECERLRIELQRSQALVRAASRSIGLSAPATQGKRKRRPRPRAVRLASALREDSQQTDGPEATSSGAGREVA